MESINEQLNIPLIKGGQTIYQPSQFSSSFLEPTRSYDYPIVKGTVYRYASADGKKDGWSGCNSCGGFSGADGQIGNIEFCVGKCKALYINKDKEAACIQECKNKFGIQTIADLMTQGLSDSAAQQIRDTVPTSLGGNKPASKTPITNTGSLSGSNSSTLSGMSKNTKIALGIGAVAIVGVLLYLKFRK